MSSQQFPPDSFGPRPDASDGLPPQSPLLPPPGPRFWLHLLLFLATFLSTSLIGSRLLDNFLAGRPAFDLEGDFSGFLVIFSHPGLLLNGLPFSVTLLLILLAHEMGHYSACAYYGIQASLPYFVPAPTVIGTFGAFIRIRSPIYSKRALFDIGVAGPLAGFVFVVPALAIGMAWSKVIPGIAERGDLVFGPPLLIKLAEHLVFPSVPFSDIYIHPIARAAWVGVIATALNLLPMGQSDGGHILYAFFGTNHRLISRLCVAALIPLGVFYWYGWLVWAGFFVFFGMRHPPTIYDDTRLGTGRGTLAWLSLLILILSFALTPIRAGSGA